MTDYSEKDYELGLEVEEGRFDQEISKYIEFLLTNNEDYYIYGSNANPHVRPQFIGIFNDWVSEPIIDSLANLVRLNLLAGEPEKAGKAMVESLQEYLTKIASDAVRERRE